MISNVGKTRINHPQITIGGIHHSFIHIKSFMVVIVNELVLTIHDDIFFGCLVSMIITMIWLINGICKNYK